LKLAPQKFWLFSQALFKEQKSFFDVNVVNETRNETYARLAKIGHSVGVDESQMLALLTVSVKPNADGDLNIGNGVTNDLKLMIKVRKFPIPVISVDDMLHRRTGWLGFMFPLRCFLM
jgi:hypothetical protein